MTDISIAVGLETKEANEGAKVYTKSLDLLIKQYEKLEKLEGKRGKSGKNSTDSKLAAQAQMLTKNISKLATAQGKLDSNANRLNKTLTKTASELSKLDRASKVASRNADKLAKSSERVTQAQKRQGAAISKNNSLWQTAKGVVAAYIGINTAKSIVNTAMAFDSLNAALGVVSGSQAGANFEFIRDTGQRLGISITTLGKEFVKLTAAAKDTIIQGQGVKDIFVAVSETSRALNLSQDDTAGAFRAITQIMSKGTVQAEELRGQLGERFAGAFQIAARAMGKTTAELNKMLEQGQVLSDEFLPRFAKQLREEIPISAESLDTLSANFGKVVVEAELLTQSLAEGGLKDALKDIAREIAVFAKSDDAKRLAQDLGEILKALSKAVVLLIENWRILLGLFVATKAVALGSFLKGVTTSILAVGTASATAVLQSSLFQKSIGVIAKTSPLAASGTQLLGKSIAFLGKGLLRAVPVLGQLYLAYEALDYLGVIDGVKEFTRELFTSTEELKKQEDQAKKTQEALSFWDDIIPEKEVLERFSDFVLEVSHLTGSLDTAKFSDFRIVMGEMGVLAGDIGESMGKLETRLITLASQQKATSEEGMEIIRVLTFLQGILDNMESNRPQLVDAQKIIEAKEATTALTIKIQGYADSLSKGKETLIENAIAEKGRLEALVKSGKASKIEIRLLKERKTALDNLTKAERESKKRNNKKKDKTTLDALQKKIKVTQLLAKATAVSNKEAFIQTQLNKLTVDALPETIAKTREYAGTLYDLENAIDYKDFLEKFEDGIDKIIEKTQDLGNSWLNVGENMEGVFGDVADIINKFGSQQLEYSRGIDEITTKLKKNKEDLDSGALKKIDHDKAETKLLKVKGDLEHKNSQAKLGYMSDIAGMVASNAKEGSALQKAAMIAQAALNFTQAQGAIAKQASDGDPYTAFARVAAMIALMSSIGISISGGGGGGGVPTSQRRQESQGTGSVLGDSSAKSESVINAFERLEDIDKDQYTELRGIFREMVSLNDNISKFAAGIVRSFGSFSGELGFDNLNLGETSGGILSQLGDALFGSTSKKLIDSGIQFFNQSLSDAIAGGIDAVAFADIEVKKKRLFGLISSTSTRTETSALDNSLTGQLGDIFASMSNTITESLGLLGIDATSALSSFIIDIGKVSFKDLTGEEIQAELEAIFSQQADLMVKHVLPSLENFQQIGEGLFETLIRVVEETAIFEQGLKLIGVGLAQFSELTGEAFLEASQEAITAAGGIEEYQEAVKKFSSEVLSGSQILALAASNATMLSNIELADIGQSLASIPDLTAFRQAFDQIKDTLSPQELVEWVQAGNALADLDTAMQSFEDSVTKVLEPFQQLQGDISNIIESLGGDLRTMESVYSALEGARQLVTDLTIIETFFNKGGKGGIQGFIREINTSVDPQQQIDAISALKDAIMERYDFEISRIETEKASLNELLSVAEAFKDSVTTLKDTVSDSLTELREQAIGFDEVGARMGDVLSLQDELASDIERSREDEVKLLGKLQKAIMSSYDAQRRAIEESFSQRRTEAENELSLLQERYQTRIAQEEELGSLQDELLQANIDGTREAAQEVYELWRSASEGLSSFLDDLLLSDLSPLTGQERFDVSESRFEETLAKALSGDATAANDLASVATDYLQEARGFFASSDQYENIFDSVREQTENVRNLADSVVGPALSAGETGIIDQIAALQAIMEPLSSQDLAGAIANQEQLLAQLSADEALQIEALRLSTIAELEAIGVRADELNAIVGGEIAGYQAKLVDLEELANSFREQTIFELASLNTLLQDLEVAREESMRLDFETLMENNTANTDRIIDAINNNNTDNGDNGDNGDTGDIFNDGGNTRDLDIFDDMRKSLDNIDNTLSGGSGGAVIQAPAENIEVV